MKSLLIAGLLLAASTSFGATSTNTVCGTFTTCASYSGPTYRKDSTGTLVDQWTEVVTTTAGNTNSDVNIIFDVTDSNGATETHAFDLIFDQTGTFTINMSGTAIGNGQCSNMVCTYQYAIQGGTATGSIQYTDTQMIRTETDTITGQPTTYVSQTLDQQ
jgi:hypothetical protein